jgi:hypothetical protein
MIDLLVSSYNSTLQWFEELPAFHQIVVSTFIMWVTVKLVKLIYERLFVPQIVKARNVRAVGKVFRFAVHEFAIRNKDTRAAFDGFFFLIERSFTYFIYACLILTIYWGISSIREGNLLAFLASVLIVLSLREAKLWLNKPSEKEMAGVNPGLKQKALEKFHSIKYDSDDETNNQQGTKGGENPGHGKQE